MTGPAELSVKAAAESVPLARNFVVEFASQVDWLGETQVERLRLAASELITNAIVAQLKVAPDREIVVRCGLSSRKMTVRVTDSGGGFELPTDLNIPEPDIDRESGFGLAIADALADDVSFTKLPDGIDVVLTMHR